MVRVKPCFWMDLDPQGFAKKQLWFPTLEGAVAAGWALAKR